MTSQTFYIGQVLPPDERFPLIEDIYRVDTVSAWRWFVVRVNPNCDDRAVESLGAKGYRAFRPTMPAVITRSRMQQVVRRSIFPRYIFVGLPVMARAGREEIDFVTPCRCDGVEGLLRNAGTPVELRVRDRGSKRIISGDEIVSAFVAAAVPENATRANVMRIRKGPLSGLLAVILDDEPGKRIEALVKLVGGQEQKMRFRRRELEDVA